MAYTDDLNSLHNPATGTNPPASWGDAIRDNFLCVERVIAHTVLGSANATISSGTLATVTNGWMLRICYRAQLTSGTGINVGARFNGDSGSNYVRQYIAGIDTAVSGDAEAAATSFLFGTVGNESASRWSTGTLEIPDYLGSGHKVGIAQTFNPGNLTTTPLLAVIGAHWASTSAITSVSITAASSTFVTGSSLTILATPSI